jgi:hypothetical protein
MEGVHRPYNVYLLTASLFSLSLDMILGSGFTFNKSDTASSNSRGFSDIGFSALDS